jgi:organic hydroperoxide reductase OsmC/OhrA
VSGGRVFAYAASLAEDGVTSAEAGAPLDLGEEWTPEHLALAALLRCTVASLRFHADRVGVGVVASGRAAGTVARRESDGRYAFVDVSVEISARLDPAPAALDALLARAEQDCFIGASLTAPPAYSWTIDGNRVPSRA